MRYGNCEIKIQLDDITKLAAGAIVHVSSGKLSAGTGVNGVLHKAAGPEFDRACMRLGGCKIGEVKITYGYNLPAKFVIHTVCPMYGQMDGMEASYLEDCYKNILAVANEHSIASIAFPTMGTGAYGFPAEESAPIAMESIKEYLEGNIKTFIRSIIFVCHSKEDLAIYQTAAEEIF